MHGLFAESQLHKYPLPLLSESLRVSEGVLRICLMPNDVLGHKGSNVGHSFTGVCMGQWGCAGIYIQSLTQIRFCLSLLAQGLVIDKVI